MVHVESGCEAHTVRTSVFNSVWLLPHLHVVQSSSSSVVLLSYLFASFENQWQGMFVRAEQCTFKNFNFKYWKMFKYFCAYLKENVWNSVANIYSQTTLLMCI